MSIIQLIWGEIRDLEFGIACSLMMKIQIHDSIDDTAVQSVSSKPQNKSGRMRMVEC